MPEQDERRVSRRAVAIAAWTVPAAGIVASAPLAAASAPCPVIAWTSWVRGANAYAMGGQDAINSTQISWATENNTANGSGLEASVTYTATVSVVAGTTYTFGYQARGGYGNNNVNSASVAYLILRVNGTALRTLTTRAADAPGTQLALYAWSPYSDAWTATSTGSVAVSFDFRVPARPTNPAITATDDIWVTLPTITCAP